MLKRASICIRSSARRAPFAPGNRLGSHRMMRSFCRHCTDGHRSGRLATRFSAGDKCLLDFLYPPHALALLRSSRTAPWSRQHNGLQRPFRRCLTSTARSNMWDDEDQLVTVEKEPRQNSEDEDPLKSLMSLLRARGRGNVELAWQLYHRIPDTDRSHQVQARFLEYVVTNDPKLAAADVLRLFEPIGPKWRLASSYRAAISAYLSQDRVEVAMSLHDEAANSLSDHSFGTELVVDHSIRTNQWDMAIEAYQAFLAQVTKAGVRGASAKKMQYQIWQAISPLSHLKRYAVALLNHVRRFNVVLQGDMKRARALRSFLSGFVPFVMQKELDEREPDEDFIMNFFQQLRELDHPVAAGYDETLRKMLLMERYRAYTSQRKIFLELYQMFKEDVDRLDSVPSEKLFSLASKQVARHGSLFKKPGWDWMTTLASLEEDWRRFHRNMDVRGKIFFMHTWADTGHADRVHRYFDELRSETHGVPDMRHVGALLHAYARRLDVQGTLAQFRRIKDEFGMEPNIVCWNILLKAYCRAEDIDRAAQVFDDILASGQRPNAHTFGTLMDACAHRGDPMGVQTLFDKAHEVGVDLYANMAARMSMVLALVNTDDLEGAERVAQSMLQDYGRNTLDQPPTPAFNILIHRFGAQRDVAATRRIYTTMQEHKVPVDSMTYAAFMRTLISIGEADAAYKILRTVMPRNNVRAFAFHYALVMSGFVADNQPHRALHAHRRMVRRGVRQTASSRMASLLALGTADLQKAREDGGGTTPTSRLVQIEEGLREIMLEVDASDVAIREPSWGLVPSVWGAEMAPRVYLEFIVLLYGRQGAFDICLTLFEASRGKEEKKYEAPMGLLNGLLEVHRRAQEWGEVEKCWQLIRAQATELAKTWKMATEGATPRAPSGNDFPPVGPSGDLVAPDARKIAQTRRRLLGKATRSYVRSLIAQSADGVDRARGVMVGLLHEGFALDNATWNVYVRALADQGRVADAFRTCETYLMSSFMGWDRRLWAAQTLRQTRLGHRYMDVRHADVRQRLLMPHYKTLVMLAAALRAVRSRDASGLGRRDDEVDVIGLEGLAPRTMRAIELMPIVPREHLQRMYLGDFGG